MRNGILIRNTAFRRFILHFTNDISSEIFETRKNESDVEDVVFKVVEVEYEKARKHMKFQKVKMDNIVESIAFEVIFLFVK